MDKKTVFRSKATVGLNFLEHLRQPKEIIKK